METRIIVSSIIERNDGKILLARKPENIGPYPNTWHIIGGGINKDETLIDALRREVSEEAGIEITDIEPISSDEDIERNKCGIKTHYIFIQFKSRYRSSEIKPGDDVSVLRRVGKSGLSSMELNKPTKILFEKINLI